MVERGVRYLSRKCRKGSFTPTKNRYSGSTFGKDMSRESSLKGKDRISTVYLLAQTILDWLLLTQNEYYLFY